jgi:hypothetical protein
VSRTADRRAFIICLTGYSRVLDAGCDLVLVKPVDVDGLERAVASGCAAPGRRRRERTYW